jgi:alpha-ribazole phosphatase
VSDELTTTFDLLRHGEPVGGSRYRGQTDDPLSETGWQQMRAAVGDHRPWDVIVSSPLSRCADFARELAARHGIPLEIEARIKEIGFGVWEGRTSAELVQSDPGVLARFWNDPLNNRPEGAEPLTAFRDRVTATWTEMHARFRGKHVLIVCHGGVIRMLLRHTLDMPLERLFRIQVPYASLSRIVVSGQGAQALPRLAFHCAHL